MEGVSIYSDGSVCSVGPRCWQEEPPGSFVVGTRVQVDPKGSFPCPKVNDLRYD